MITPYNISVSSYTFGELNIYWEIENPLSEDLSTYVLDLYRGEIPDFDSSDYTIVASGIDPEDYDYNDTSVEELSYNQWRDLYYSLIPRKVSTGVLGEATTPVRMVALADNAAREIVRRQAIAFRSTTHPDGYGGEPIQILKRKTYGTHCTVCWDPMSQRNTISDCETCFGTGFVGGFYTPIAIDGMINSAPQLTQLLEFGEWQDSDAILTIGPYPPIKPRDYVIDKLNRRWVIISSRFTQKGLYTITQNCQIRLASKDDIIQKYTITWSS